MVCYGAVFLLAHAGVGLHVLETLRGQLPLHGIYMFLSLFAGLGIGHFLTCLTVGCTGNECFCFCCDECRCLPFDSGSGRV